MMSLKTAWMSFADEKLAEPIAELADAINSLDPDTLANVLTGATALAGTLGAVWAGRKAYTMGKGVMDFVRGSKSSGGGAGLPGLPSGDVSKVYVTNMPADGFGGDVGTRRKRRRGKARPRSMPGRALSSASKLGGLTRRLPYVGAALGALSLFNNDDDSLSGKEKSTQVGGTVGNMGGAMAGAAAGAAIGSVVPVIGTAIGGLAVRYLVNGREALGAGR